MKTEFEVGFQMVPNPLFLPLLGIIELIAAQEISELSFQPLGGLR